MDDTSKMKENIGFGNFTFDGSSHQTGDPAFTPATPPRLTRRANTDPRSSNNTQHTRLKPHSLCVMQKGTQPSQATSEGLITPTQSRCRWSLFASL